MPASLLPMARAATISRHELGEVDYQAPSLQSALSALGLAPAVFRYAGAAVLGTVGAASTDSRELVVDALDIEPGLRGGTLYLCGGWGSWGEPPVACVDRLDVSFGIWEAAQPMPSGRHSAAAAAMAGCLYVVGGVGSDALELGPPVPLATVIRLETDRRTWSPAPPMPAGRCDAGAAALNCALYVCGGQSLSDPALCTTIRLRLDADEWEELSEMEEGRAGLAMSAVLGHLYVFGGRDVDACALDSAEYLEPDSSEWEALPCMMQKRWGAAAACVSLRLFVCGGIEGAGGKPLASVEEFDYITCIWSYVASMLEGRLWLASASSGGQLFVCGGVGNGYETLKSMERFDPMTGTWSLSESLAIGRRGAVFVVA